MNDEMQTFVIFSMLFTDFSRSSISLRVAMLRAFGGAAPSAWGCAVRRVSVRRASMVEGQTMGKWTMEKFGTGGKRHVTQYYNITAIIFLGRIGLPSDNNEDYRFNT
jgi:hypothetical protein